MPTGRDVPALTVSALLVRPGQGVAWHDRYAGMATRSLSGVLRVILTAVGLSELTRQICLNIDIFRVARLGFADVC